VPKRNSGAEAKFGCRSEIRVPKRNSEITIRASKMEKEFSEPSGESKENGVKKVKKVI